MSPLAFVADWLGDETLYSWCARFHLVCGNGSARHTSAVLFGGEHAVREREAPLRLQHFVDVTHGSLGSVESILRTRTAIGLYWPFIDTRRRENLRTSFERASGSSWVTQIGMPASALTARELRYCPECVVEDCTSIGIPRWRLPHQLSCAHVCLDHAAPLAVCRIKASTWLLPPRSGASIGLQVHGALSAEARQVLQRLAYLAWKCIGVDAIDLSLVRAAVLHRLREEGVSSWQFPLDETRLASWFRNTSLARSIRDLKAAPDRLDRGVWVHALLRRRREEHPVLWLMLWCATHTEESPEALTASFVTPAMCPVVWDERGQGCLWSPPRVALPPNVMDLIVRSGSLKRAAGALGISVFTLRRQLELEGCHGGEFFGRAWAEQRREEALEAVREYVARKPGCSRTAVHRDCKAAVAWLERNAKEDLVRLLSKIPERRPRQQALFPGGHLPDPEERR